MVYAKILPDASRSSILPIIERFIRKSSSNIYTDKWRSYDGLALKHYQINHSKKNKKAQRHTKESVLPLFGRVGIPIQ